MLFPKTSYMSNAFCIIFHPQFLPISHVQHKDSTKRHREDPVLA